MIRHIGTESIQTGRLLLRRYHEGDAADIYRNYAADERVARFLTWRPYTDVAEVERFVAAQIFAYSNNMYDWVMEYEGQVVGNISVTTMDERNEACEIGYCLGHDFWGKGIMTEAVTAVLGYLFGRVGFNRVMAKHDVENPASGKVMQKCGMAYEGRLRQAYLRHDGSYSDALLYSILKNEC